MSSSESCGDSFEFDEEQQEILVRNFQEEALLITKNLLPKKSILRYERIYEDFRKWQNEINTELFSEDILLVYFNEVSKKVKPSTIWARWSMLKTTLDLRHNVSIGNYHRLIAFLKNFSKGYKPKKSKVFNWKHIEKFLEEADDHIYLCMKVVLIFGICGALRCQEFIDISINDVEDTGSQFIIEVRDTKTDYPRSFVIGRELYSKVKQYLLLRPTDLESKRFFLTYSKGKCVRQFIGKNKISEVPKNIALYLNLENPELFTGHSFRRIGATLLSNSGASLVEVKNLGGWKSDSVVQGYIEKSLAVKEKNFNGIISERQVSIANKNNEPSSTITSSCNNLGLVKSREPFQNIQNVNYSEIPNRVSIPQQTKPVDSSCEILEIPDVSNKGVISQQKKSVDNRSESSEIPIKKKVCKESSMNTENEYGRLYSITTSNCEHFTINNYYSCAHNDKN